MGKSQSVNSPKVDSANEFIKASVLVWLLIYHRFTLLTLIQSSVTMVPDAEEITTVNEKISVASQELSVDIGSVAASSIPAAHTTSSPVQASVPGGAGNESRPLTTLAQKVISGRPLMKDNEFMRMLLKDKQEKDLKRKFVAAKQLTTQKEDFKGIHHF